MDQRCKRKKFRVAVFDHKRHALPHVVKLFYSVLLLVVLNELPYAQQAAVYIFNSAAYAAIYCSVKVEAVEGSDRHCLNAVVELDGMPVDFDSAH